MFAIRRLGAGPRLSLLCRSYPTPSALHSIRRFSTSDAPLSAREKRYREAKQQEQKEQKPKAPRAAGAGAAGAGGARGGAAKARHGLDRPAPTRGGRSSSNHWPPSHPKRSERRGGGGGGGGKSRASDSRSPPAAVTEAAAQIGLFNKTFPTTKTSRSFNRNSIRRHHQSMDRLTSGGDAAAAAAGSSGDLRLYARPKPRAMRMQTIEQLNELLNSSQTKTDAAADDDENDATAAAEAESDASIFVGGDTSNLPVDISSTQSSLVKLIRALSKVKRERVKHGLFVVEGQKSIDAFICANAAASSAAAASASGDDESATTIPVGGLRWKPKYVLIRSDCARPPAWQFDVDVDLADAKREAAKADARDEEAHKPKSLLDDLLEKADRTNAMFDRNASSSYAAASRGGEKIVYRVNSKVMDAVSSLSTPSGYLAVFHIPSAAASTKSTSATAHLTPVVPPPPPINWSLGGLIIDGLADPGNLGTIVRSALAFGWTQVVLLDNTMDLFSPKVVGASAGAISGLTSYRTGMSRDELVAMIKASGAGTENSMAGRILALVPNGGVSPLSLPVKPYWVIVGNEARGLSPELEQLCDSSSSAMQRVTVPMALSTVTGSVDSLNAGIATAISLFSLSPYRKKKIA